MNKPIRNDMARYRTVDSIARDVNLCNAQVLRLAREAAAVIKVGRATRINAEKFFTYLEEEYKG